MDFFAARFSCRFSFRDFCAGFFASFFCLSAPFIAETVLGRRDGGNRGLQHESVRVDTYGGHAMPQWITLLLLAIVAWLALSVGGGLIIGRLLAVASRRRRIV
jgi:hypothetical protein